MKTEFTNEIDFVAPVKTASSSTVTILESLIIRVL